MKEQNFKDDEMKYILRQLGFGAMLGMAFISVCYFGGLIAQCVSNF